MAIVATAILRNSDLNNVTDTVGLVTALVPVILQEALEIHGCRSGLDPEASELRCDARHHSMGYADVCRSPGRLNSKKTLKSYAEDSMHPEQFTRERRRRRMVVLQAVVLVLVLAMMLVTALFCNRGFSCCLR